MFDRRVLLNQILTSSRSPPKSGWSPKSLDPVAAMNLYRHGYTLAAIGEHFGCHPATVRNAIKHFPDYKELAKEQQAYNNGRRAGSGRPKGRTDTSAAKQAERGWEFYLDGASVPEIAGFFEVHRNSIRRAFLRYYKSDYERISELRRKDRNSRDRHFSRELAWELFSKNGLSPTEVANRLHVTISSITRALSEIDGYKEILTEREFPADEAWTLYQAGWTTDRIADRFGITSTQVQRRLKGYEGYAEIANTNLSRGLAVGHNRKVREETRVEVDVDQVLALYHKGYSQDAIAVKLGVGRMVIRHRLAEHGLAAKHKGKKRGAT